jgi:signal transduction histidine kinase
MYPLRWHDDALLAPTFDQCLERVLAACTEKFGATWSFAHSPAWSGWRGGPPPWPEVLEPLRGREVFAESRDDVLALGTRALAPGDAECALAILPAHGGGSLAVVFDHALSFPEHVRAELRELVAVANPVLERAALLCELQREKRRWQLIGDVGLAVTSSLEFAGTLERIVRLMVPDFADWAAVDLVTSSGTYERVAVACADEDKDMLAQQLERREYKPTAQTAWGVSSVIGRGEPQLVPEFTEEMIRVAARDDLHLRIMRAMAVRSYLSVPLTVGERAIGALSLGSCLRAYDERDLEVAVELARRASIAIENARLYTIEQRTAHRLRKLHEATVGLSSAKTPEEIATVATQLGADAVEAEAAALWIRSDDGAFVLAGSHGIPAVHIAPFVRFTSDIDLPVGTVARTHISVWIETPEQFEQVAPAAYLRAAEARRIRAFCAMPILSGGELLGIASFIYPQEHKFSDDERVYLHTLVDATAQAIERAQLFVSERTAHDRAEAASRAKDEFLAMLGHELRNPLAPIVTALDLMKLMSNGRLAREPAIIERHVHHLTHLVDDLLDIARITRGAVVLRRQPLDLVDAVREAIEAVDPLVEDRVHALHVDVQRGIRVDADRSRLVQVLTNLLTNAAKYTPPGGAIDITAHTDDSAAVIRVRDNGKGISPKLLPKIFDLFVQGERSADRSEGGLGLGLSIVKNLVAMHGGTISASSAGPGQGAEFTVRWPLATSVGIEVVRAEASSHRCTSDSALRILVVDDNMDAAEMLGEALRMRGHEVVIAYDSAAALATVEKAKPHVAILDIGLPVMDGYELAERIRQNPELANMQLVALTGFGTAGDVERAKRAGFDRHFVKPLDMAQLDAMLTRSN